MSSSDDDGRKQEQRGLEKAEGEACVCAQKKKKKKKKQRAAMAMAMELPAAQLLWLVVSLIAWTLLLVAAAATSGLPDRSSISSSSISTSGGDGGDGGGRSAEQEKVVFPAAAARVALFVMGDSLVDAGNNNFIASTARANFAPHGLDYAVGPTGRFCNGKIINDFISDFVGSPPIKPYLDPTNDLQSLLYGSNFASAGAGILNSTGRQFIKVLTADDQLGLFADYKQRVSKAIGAAMAEELLNSALYSLTFGGNDYINNYLRLFSSSSMEYTLPQYQQLLLSAYKAQLTRLYHMGARKFTIAGLGPLGCIPSQLNKNKVADGRCIEELQQIAVSFNAGLKSMTEELNRELLEPKATFLFIDSYGVAMEFINNPEAYGYDADTVTTACCGQGMYNGRFICNMLSSVCPDRRTHVFWDPFHPTEKTNALITRRIIDGPPSVISPINVRQLLQL